MKREVKIKDQINKIDKRVAYWNIKIEKMQKRVQAEIQKLEDEKTTLEMKLSTLKKARSKRCKHNGKIIKRYNARSDASFEYFLICAKCDQWIGSQRFDGSVKCLVSLTEKQLE